MRLTDEITNNSPTGKSQNNQAGLVGLKNWCNKDTKIYILNFKKR